MITEKQHIKIKNWKRKGIARLYNFWLGPVDPIRLDSFRVALGLSMLMYMTAWWRYAEEWLTSAGFHVSTKAFISAPVFPLLPQASLPLFGTLLFGSLILWILGIKTRAASFIVLGCMVYVSFADHLASYTLNKLFIVALSVLVCVPQGSYWSLEHKEPSRQSVWPVRILQATLLILYFFCGWGKIFYGNWVEYPGVLWSQVQGPYRTDLAAWMLRTFPAGIWSWMQYATLTFELLAPFLFISRRFRVVGLWWGWGFQMMVALTMHQLIYFSLAVLSFYVLFLEEKTLHRIRIFFTRGRQFYYANPKHETLN